MEKKQSLFATLKAKLENYHTLATVFFIVGVAGALFGVLAYIFYGTQGVFQSDEYEVNQGYGAIYFMVNAVFTIASGVLAYLSFPFMLNKEKLSPNKYLGFLSLGIAVVGLVMVVLSILVIPLGVKVMGQVTETPIPATWVIVAVLFLLTAVVDAYLIIPALSVKSYMPAPKGLEA